MIDAIIGRKLDNSILVPGCTLVKLFCFMLAVKYLHYYIKKVCQLGLSLICGERKLSVC